MAVTLREKQVPRAEQRVKDFQSTRENIKKRLAEQDLSENKKARLEARIKEMDKLEAELTEALKAYYAEHGGAGAAEGGEKPAKASKTKH